MRLCAPLLAAALLAGCAAPLETVEHRDEAGLWSCPASRPGECYLLEPAAPRIDLRGLDEGALAA